MTTKMKVVLIFALFVGAFALGRYTVSQPEIKTESEVKTDVKKQVDRDNKKKSVTTTTESPTGEKSTTTVTEEETTTHVDTDKSTDARTEQTVTPQKRNTLNVSALIGVNSRDLASGPLYGVSVTKEVIGPFTLGAFLIYNGVAGMSVGVDF